MNEPPFNKVSLIVAHGTLENAYAGCIMAHGARSEGIEANMFFTFFGLEVITKKHVNKIATATVGNPAMHIPTIVGGLPGMQSFATHMMKKQIEALDVPGLEEFFQLIHDEGVKLYACKLTFDMFKLKKEDLIEQVDDIVTVGEFYNIAGNDDRSQIVFI